MSEWTLEQAAELVLESLVTLLDGCDDDDVMRPEMVFRAVQQAWAPDMEFEDWPEMTAGEMRARTAVARRALADGERIP